MSVRVTVQFKIQQGKAGEFEAAAGTAIAQVKAEDEGCEMYDLFKSVDDDARYVLVESWESQEHLEKHRSSPAMAAMQKIGPFMDGRPTMHFYGD